VTVLAAGGCGGTASIPDPNRMLIDAGAESFRRLWTSLIVRREEESLSLTVQEEGRRSFYLSPSEDRWP